jgi:predicted phage terminase large subunit-like protein
MTDRSIEDPLALFRALCQQVFTAFLRKAWPTITGGDTLKWNWHLDAIAYRLERVQSQETRRSLINLPPRNGKSKTISVIWIAWMLGRDPTLNFVCVSYSNELSGKMARDCRAIMESHWYKELFPGTVISRNRSASYDFETTRGGGRLATSVTGTLTGRGGDIIVLDDVIKPEEAHSDTTRNAVNDWYRSTLASRLNDKKTGAIVCVMQRLHENDLSGMLLEDGGWDHLALPAIAKEDSEIPLTKGKVYFRRKDEVLHADREPLKTLEEQREATGSHVFEAQYQQEPMPAEGNLYKADWLKTFAGDPVGDRLGEIIQSWDCAIKTGIANDYSVCITACIIRDEIHVVNIWRGKVEFPVLQAKAIELARLHNADTLIIEDKASGQQLVQALRSLQARGVPRPIAINPELDKYSRAAGVSSMVEAGQLFLLKDAHWLTDFKKEFLAFPNARHDDQVDAMSQLLDRVRRRRIHEPSNPVGGTVYIEDDYGTVHSSDDDDWEHTESLGFDPLY